MKKNKNFQFSKNIKFQNVSFTYDNKKFIFKNFSGHFLKNKIIGISGKSGSGKSTLVDLITGLLKPNKGQILVDEMIDIHDGNLFNWQKIGYVSQQVFLLDDTVTNNIGFGFNDEDIDIGKVHEVLKDVQLYDYFNYQEKNFKQL